MSGLGRLLGLLALDAAIGEALFITEKTASVHVSSILAKLGVPNRGAAARLGLADHSAEAHS